MTGKPVYRRILITEAQIRAAVDALARRVEAYCADGEEVVALVVLEGARRFADDLLGRVRTPVSVRTIRASSYHGGTASSGEVRLEAIEELAAEIRGRRVLVIDDIYDTGLTLAAILEKLRACGAAEVRTCVFLQKQAMHRRAVAIDFPGMEVEDVFVIGYGLDYQGRYRELPFVAELSEDQIKNQK